MTLHKFIAHQLEWHGKTEEQSRDDWASKLETLPTSCISEDRTMMLLPNQKTVVAGNSRNHTEQVTSGHCQERNPTPEDLSCAVANLGQDHHSFNDPL